MSSWRDRLNTIFSPTIFRRSRRVPNQAEATRTVVGSNGTTYTIRPGANLRGAQLEEADLRGVNLRGVTFSEANLYEAKLTGADLSGAILVETGLTGADLSGANLTGAVLSGAYLTNANLRGANLTGAILTGADLNGANLTNAIFTDATLTSADFTDAIGIEDAIDIEDAFGYDNESESESEDEVFNEISRIDRARVQAVRDVRNGLTEYDRKKQTDNIKKNQKEIQDSLKRAASKAQAVISSDGEGDACPICGESLNNGSIVDAHNIDGKKSGHVFHKECILRSCKYNHFCPVCRVNINCLDIKNGSRDINTKGGKKKTRRIKKHVRKVKKTQNKKHTNHKIHNKKSYR